MPCSAGIAAYDPNLYNAADTLTDEERRRERGAFFGSIQGTLSHILWADRMWMSRFTNVPKPDGGIKDINVGLRWNWTLKQPINCFTIHSLATCASCNTPSSGR